MITNQFAISVIIPTYNRCKYLRYTLNSLVKQNLDKSQFEVVIVDDGSSDDTFQMIRTYENIINIKYVYQADNGYRVGSARNLGIKVAGGAICMFIDSGIIVKSDCIKQHLNYHKKKKEEVALIGYTYGYTQYGDAEKELASLIDPNNADVSIETLVKLGKFQDVRDNIYKKYNNQIENLSVPWTLFFGGHLSIKKESLFEVGLFDEHFDGNWGCEDNDLGYRLHKANKQIALCREAIVLHLPHGSDNDVLEQQGLENCLYFNNKYQTPETQLFLDFYLSEISSKQTIDFHEILINSKILQV